MRTMRFCAIFLAIAAPALPARAAETLTVQVREAVLRASASMLAAPVNKVPYATPVAVEERAAGWARVTPPAGPAGWVHESALTRKKLQLAAGGETTAAGASTREVALAGKGFNEQIEKEMRKTNTAADFSWVDRMEKMQVSAARLSEFLREGGVLPPSGDGQ